MRRLYPDAWEPARFEAMLGRRDLYRAFLDGASPAELERSWGAGLRRFETLRARYLRYAATD